MSPINRTWARIAITIVVVSLFGAACTTGGSPGTTPTTATPTSLPVPDPCEDEIDTPFAFDLDGDGLVEITFFSGDDLVVCLEDARLSVEVVGQGLEISGFLDLDGDGTSEILFYREAERGRELGAAKITLRGLRLTSLGIEHWIEDPGNGAPFVGESFQCLDWDDDGDTELVHRHFMPADEEVNLRTTIVELDGLDAVEGGGDSYETTVDGAHAIWSSADGCDPEETVGREIRFSNLGWAKVALPSEFFDGKDDIVLTSAAVNDQGVVAAVGLEGPNVALGTLVEARPLVWWSPDGLDWRQAEVEGTDAELLDVVSYDGGFLAVGRMGRDPAVWTSQDGSSWSAIALDTTLEGGQGVMYSVIAANDGLIAVGAENYWPENGAGLGDSDAAVWISDDGLEWSRIRSASFGKQGYQPNEGSEFNGAIFDVAFDVDVGYIAIGYDSDADPFIDFPDQYPAIWTSSDAESWERSRLDQDARLTGIVAEDGRFAAFGSSDRNGSPTADGVIITSTDGATWTSASGDFSAIGGEDGIQTINALTRGPDGTWLALGSDETELDAIGAVAVWESGDLVNWARQPNDLGAFGDVAEAPAPFINSAVTTNNGLLIAVGASGLTVELTGGGSVCCLYRPHIIAYDPLQTG